ncbi:MAG TPA: alpha-hydroxy-acid oxidizing protein [Acetobacteraceae bacterium]|nr:alpha-hydroxy-acid oxidizing protein [Acetobacteraceae bacterium]
MLVGRPFLFAAVYAGEAGVRHAISLLSKEIDRDMAMLGLRRIGEMRQELLIKARAAA